MSSRQTERTSDDTDLPTTITTVLPSSRYRAATAPLIVVAVAGSPLVLQVKVGSARGDRILSTQHVSFRARSVLHSQTKQFADFVTLHSSRLLLAVSGM